MPSLASSGRTLSLKYSACRRLSSREVCRVFSSTWSGAISVVTPSTGRPVAIRRIRPATRTMKNSSRLLAKMAMNRTRSSSGTFSSSANSSTRWLNRSQLSSRSMYRSGGRSSAVSAPVPSARAPSGAVPALISPSPV